MGIKNQNKHYNKEKNTSSFKMKKLINGIDKLPNKDDSDEYLNIIKIITKLYQKPIAR